MHAPAIDSPGSRPATDQGSPEKGTTCRDLVQAEKTGVQNGPCPHLDRVPTTSADGLNFDSDFDDDDMDEAETAHLEHKTAKNIKCTLRKWDQYINEKYNGVHPDFEQINSKKVSQIVITFFKNLDNCKPFTNVKSLKNVLSHINRYVLLTKGKDYTKDTGMRTLECYVEGLKKKVSKRQDLAPAKPVSVGYNRSMFETMYSSITGKDPKSKTTDDTLRLVNMTVDAWLAPRTITKDRMRERHILFVKDPVTDATSEDTGVIGCGYKVVKNYTIDKTHLIIGECSRAQAGVHDCETTMYCQCLEDGWETCPVKVLLEYNEVKKDVTIMSSTFGASDGSWNGNPKAKSEKHKVPVQFDNLHYFRAMKVTCT
jgi:hypothetical protein